jgi:transcriptional regulator of arginine metabolism
MKKPAAKKMTLQHALLDLLQKGKVETQEEIKKELSERGFVVNQPKISRLLNDLGAIKIKEAERVIYRLPTELVPITAHHPLANLVLTIEFNEYLIVVHTSPGSAQLVARLLDQNTDIGILGTVAGDDTIFITPRQTKDIATIAKKVTELLRGK